MFKFIPLKKEKFKENKKINKLLLKKMKVIVRFIWNHEKYSFCNKVYKIKIERNEIPYDCYY